MEFVVWLGGGLAFPDRAATWLLPLVTPVCLWVAASDLRHMKIRNNAVLALAAIWLAVAPFLVPLDLWAWQWLNLVIVLAAGFVLNAIGAMGAGDAKFCAAAALFVLPQDAGAMIYILGCILLLVFVLHRAARATPPVRAALPGWASWTAKKFPMGLALGPSLFAYLALAAAF